MRVFVAIPIPPSLQEVIRSWAARRGDLPVRWLKDKNLHITLVPPWEEEPARIPETLARLREAVGELRDPIPLHFARVRFGPDPRRPRLIWAEGEAPQALTGFKERCEKLFGSASEHQPWLVHLTIARFRPEDFASFPVQKLDETVAWHGEVRSVTLMESHLLRGGAEYEVLGKFAFQ